MMNPLTDISNAVTLIQVADKHGNNSHCICTVGKWIFDSNFNFALPLNEASMDLVCSDENEEKNEGKKSETISRYQV